jgi:hypothetical protein
MALLHRHVAHTAPVGDYRPAAVTEGRSATPAQFASLIIGALLIVVGVIAMVRAGVDGTLNDPVVSILGFDHTAAIGIGEVVVGALLVLSALTPAGRVLSGLLGILMAAFGIVLLVASDQLLADLHTERALGWPALILGVILVLAAVMSGSNRRVVV